MFDIEKAFLQIELKRYGCDAHHFLWYESTPNRNKHYLQSESTNDEGPALRNIQSIPSCPNTKALSITHRGHFPGDNKHAKQ